MYTDSQKINFQKDILKKFFSEIIDSKYVYIDVPLYPNIGDWLIALGAWELLKDLPYRCVGRWRWDDVEPKEIDLKTIVLLQGGGNFGDLYRGATEARNKIISMFPDNKIIILPQTITYLNQNLIKLDVEVCAQHKDLHICARDNQSYQILLQYFKKNKIYLLPDTALGLYGLLPQQLNVEIEKTLILNRCDKEALELFIDSGDIREWNDIMSDINFNVVWIPYRLLHKVKKMLNSTILRRLENKYILNILYPFIKRYIPQYFLRYQLIKTTRLHGYLLALIMHIPVEILDSKYQKIHNYNTTWNL